MFTKFSKVVHARLVEMSLNELFVVEIEDIFTKYLDSFPAGTNPIYRTRTVHDCQCCKQFIKNFGCVVAIQNQEMITVWGNHDLPEFYQIVSERMHDIVKSGTVKSVFRTKERKYGTDHNYGKDDIRYDHFYGDVAVRHCSLNADTLRGEQNSIYQVFQRGLNEIKETDIRTVLDLINQNQLYRGEEHKSSILGFQTLLHNYQNTGKNDLFIWEHLNNRNARFRNTVIGTLLTDLAQGVELEQAVKSFEQKVAPTNYKRTTSIITQRMVEDAVQKLTDLGLGGAIYRRYAKLSDVSVNDVLFVDNNSKAKMKNGVAALLESSIKKSPPDLKHSIPIDANSFVSTILPNAKELEAFVENRHVGNFVSLTGGDGPERLFKWNNNFAWSYDGDVTDSVKQRVKAAGGNINAKLRISLSWFNFDDLDLHAITPNEHIYYANKRGILDVDMNAGLGKTRNAVENLAFNKLHDGKYDIYVNQFSRRETIDFGFAIEIEYAGMLRQFSYPKAVLPRENIKCFDLTIKNGELCKIESPLKEGTSSQEKWGIKTETLVPVVAVMYSPNHWNGEGIGAKHLIFALENCKNPEPVRGIYNEFLRSEFEVHRKVFEVLGAKTKCQPTDEQISGVGFTAARGDTVTIVVDGRKSYAVSF